MSQRVFVCGLLLTTGTAAIQAQSPARPDADYDSYLAHVAAAESALRLGDLALIDTAHFEVTAVLRPHVESMWHCEWSPDGQVLASTAMDGTIAITDPRPLRERLWAVSKR